MPIELNWVAEPAMGTQSPWAKVVTVMADSVIGDPLATQSVTRDRDCSK